MKSILPLLLAALFVVSCEQTHESPMTANTDDAPQDPPVEIQVIAPAVEKQFTDQFADGFARVGKVRFDGSSDVYHVEVFYTEARREKRYVMEFTRIVRADRPNLVVYRGTFPADLPDPGNQSTGVAEDFDVTIDEMMNEQNGSQQDAAPKP
jgi:hypothetical protein